MSEHAAPAGSEPRSPVLRWLVAIEHAIFGVLLAVGFIRSLTSGASVWLTVILAGLLAGWYLLGVRGAVRNGTGWLLVLTALWVGSVGVSTEFVWLAFALWLLSGHFLRLGPAIGYAAAVLAVTVTAPWLATRQIAVAGIIGPAIGAVFALVISLAQYQLLREDRQRRELVSTLVAAQAETAALHDQLSALERESGARDERTRIGRDVHDTIAQDFSSILLLARGGAMDPGATLRQIESVAAQGLAQSREVVGALAPTDLESDGLSAALTRLLDELSAQTGIEATLRSTPDLPPLSRPAQIALLRTCQGALANVRQHSGATRVVVTLEHSEDAIRLDIVDDGDGFDASNWATRSTRTYAHGGYGLPSTRARLREIGGGLDIESAPGQGTALTAYVPVEVPINVPVVNAPVTEPRTNGGQR